MTELLNLFVYGTLRPPQADTPAADARYFSAISEYTRHHQPATLAHAQLYDLGEYPAAAPGVGTIHGDLLQVDPAAVPIADRIEGHPTFYRRAEVMVQTAIGAARAWVYWAPPGMTTARPRITHGDWFQRHVATTPDQQLPVESDLDPVLRTLVTRFADEPCSWLSSVRPDSRAHLVPVWHVWHQGRAYVVTQIRAVKTINIRDNPSVTIAHPDPLNVLILEGWAIATNFMRDHLQPLFLAKYNWDIAQAVAKDVATHTVIEITPTKLLAWGSYGEGKWAGTDVLRVW